MSGSEVGSPEHQREKTQRQAEGGACAPGPSGQRGGGLAQAEGRNVSEGHVGGRGRPSAVRCDEGARSRGITMTLGNWSKGM